MLKVSDSRLSYKLCVRRRRRRRRRVRVVSVRVNSMDWLNERFSNDCRHETGWLCAFVCRVRARRRPLYFFPWRGGYAAVGRGVGMPCGGGGGRPASLLSSPRPTSARPPDHRGTGGEPCSTPVFLTHSRRRKTADTDRPVGRPRDFFSFPLEKYKKTNRNIFYAVRRRRPPPPLTIL